MDKRYIVLHHTADSAPDPQYQKVWDYHNSGAGGKWPKGYGMQYHYFIGKNGTVKQSHPEDATLWHSGTSLYNKQGIGVCLAGNLTVEIPTPAQINSLTALIDDIQKRFGIPDSSVKLHREVRPNPTTCPGIDLRSLAFSNRKKVTEDQLRNAKAAILKPSVTPQRKAFLQRVIDRIQSLASNNEDCC